MQNTTKIEDFRSINTLPGIDRIFEKVVVEFVNNKNILTNYQSGFRKGVSQHFNLFLMIENQQNI